MIESSGPGARPPLPMELLFEAGGRPTASLPAKLEELYGGGLELPRPILYSNFVTSLDGVAVLGPSSGSTLSGNSQADRFVMGLLRSCADAILIGSGTLRGSPGHVWTGEHVYPPSASEFRTLRRQLGLPEHPTLVIASGSGAIDLTHPGLARPAVLLTTEAGRRRLGPAGPHEVVVLGPGPELDPAAMTETLRQAGHAQILTEGGPRLQGQLLRAGQLDQLFLTLSPLLAGRTDESRRAGFVDGVDLLADGRRSWLSLLSARRSQSHLFLRYQVRAGASPA